MFAHIISNKMNCPGHDKKVSFFLLMAIPFLVVYCYYQIESIGNIRYLQAVADSVKISGDDHSKMPNVLIYITTHMSQQHKDFLKHCWPLALKNSQLLNSSDIKVFMTPEPTQVHESIELLQDTFKEQNFTYHINLNLGYHEGAIAAMLEAAKNGWFNGYDWVFR